MIDNKICLIIETKLGNFSRVESQIYIAKQETKPSEITFNVKSLKQFLFENSKLNSLSIHSAFNNINAIPHPAQFTLLLTENLDTIFVSNLKLFLIDSAHCQAPHSKVCPIEIRFSFALTNIERCLAGR